MLYTCFEVSCYHFVFFSVLLLHLLLLQGDQKVFVHLQVTSNVQSVPRQSPDIY